MLSLRRDRGRAGNARRRRRSVRRPRPYRRRRRRHDAQQRGARPTITALAERHRECPIILAHAAISDLRWVWEAAPAHPNLFFDTSWWSASDLIALFALVPPGRILFGSDTPYMDLEMVLAITLRGARFAGLSSEAVALVAGGQLGNRLAAEPAVDAGPPPGPPRVAAA